MVAFAVEIYKKIDRAEKRIVVWRASLEKYLRRMKPTEVARYIKITETWQAEQDAREMEELERQL